MNEKLSFPNLVDALSAKTGVSKKVAEAFAKSFFDTIVEALYMGESSIKVKGLGIFRLVDVESRESVNVSNGERIVIPGYKKVSFTPDDGVVEALNVTGYSAEADSLADSIAAGTEDDESAKILEVVPNEADLNTSDDNEIVSSTKEPDAQVLDMPDVPEDAQDADENVLRIINDVTVSDVEKTDSLSQIDMLISTPESVDEVKQQLAMATVKSEEAIALAKDANRERMRLEQLLSRLEDNSIPKSEDERIDDKGAFITETETSYADTEKSPSDENEEAVETDNDVNSDEPSVDESTQTEASEDVEEEHVIVGEDNALNRLIARKAIESQGAISGNRDEQDEDEPSVKRGTRIAIWIIASIFVVALVACVIFFLRKTSESIESVKQLPAVEEKTANPLDSLMLLRDSIQKHDSVASSVNVGTVRNVSDSEKQINEEENSKGKNSENVKAASASKPTDSVRPKTHVVKPGESLTRISMRYYNTKDSVRAIIRANSFPDPDNVPVGATVKLP